MGYEDNEENNFFPGQVSRSYKATVIKCTLLCFLLPHFTLFSSYIPPTIAALAYMTNGNASSQLPQNLPYYSWVPFKFDTGCSYLIALGYQAGPMFSYGYR
ncbi:hypothetical protein NQ314_001945 [Rhamnusium bicolor]|uniref:Uncharacterized protein n=1 Tax=Rhamnusium bicolor TaxID=1586634 RepID=A0AAV8ZU71_9CUCU|nr:hypothetical protein NQ314_001945 [Rhamnusium bicolor]